MSSATQLTGRQQQCVREDDKVSRVCVCQ